MVSSLFLHKMDTMFFGVFFSRGVSRTDNRQLAVLYIFKCIISNESDAVGNRNGCQAGTIGKGVISDESDAVGNRNGSQAGTKGKRTVSNDLSIGGNLICRSLFSFGITNQTLILF